MDNIDLQSFKSSGKGFGMDLGLGVTLFENFQAHLGFLDMGSINFNRNTINYTKNDTYTYDGIDINQQGDAINTGNLDEMLQPEKTYNSYKMPLPTKLILSRSVSVQEKAKRKVTYFVHNVSVTYVQGFRNYLSSTKKPALNVGYAYNFKNLVNTGASFTVGRVNKVMAGAHLGFRLGAIKLGLASNNFLPLLSAKAGRGTDVNLYLGFYF